MTQAEREEIKAEGKRRRAEYVKKHPRSTEKEIFIPKFGEKDQHLKRKRR